MAKAEHALDVNVPVREAYNQWTQFESFPQFMEGVKEVRQLNDKRLHWIAEIAGKTVEWDAEITEQIPDDRIAWKSTSGDPNAGVVTFHYLEPAKTRVMLQLDYSPQGAIESAGAALGVLDRRVKGDMERFKQFIENQGQATGEWRGTIENHPELGA